MKSFKDDAPLRLTLAWEPPIKYANEPYVWEHIMGNFVEDARLYDHFHYNVHEIVGDKIHFYLHTKKRKNQLKKDLRQDKNWRRFVEDFPEVTLTWADEVPEGET